MSKKWLYVFFGFAIGFVVANTFFIPELMAQYGKWAGASFTEMEMQPPLPSRYGNLVAVSGLTMYFQASDGAIHIVKPRTGTEFDTSVTMIKRSE